GGNSAVDRFEVSDLRLTGASGGSGNANSGIRITSNSSVGFFTFDNVTSTDNSGRGLVTDVVGTVTDLEILNSEFSGNGSVGVRIPTSSSIDGLKIENTDILNNGGGLWINDGESNVHTAQNISLTDVTIGGSASPSDVFIFGLDGPLSLEGVDFTGAPSSFYGLYLLGAYESETLAPVAPNITLDNVTFTGTYPSGGINFLGWSDLSNVSMTDVVLNETVTSTTRGHIRLSGVGGTLDLGNTSFDGTTAALDIVMTSNFGAAGSKSTVAVDGTTAIWSGKTGAGMSDTERFAQEDRIRHALDDTTDAPGLVTYVSENVFVTQASGSIERGVSASSPGGTVNVTGELSLAGVGTNSVASPNFAIDEGANYVVNIASVGPNQFDQLDVTGTVTIEPGATLSFAPTGSPVINDNDVFLIIANDGVDPVSGTFAGLTEGTVVSTDFLGTGKAAWITYAGGDGNDVEIRVGGPVTVDGTPGDDDIVLRLNATTGWLEVVVNGIVTETRPTAGVGLITINGTDGNDTLTLDFAEGSPIPADLVFNGGNPNVGPGDALRILGTGTESIVYNPSAGTFGNGGLTIDGQTVTFTGLEPIDVIGAGSVSLILANANDVVTIENGSTLVGALDALRIHGTSGGVGFEELRVRNTGNITVDTTGVDGNDLVTLSSATNAHGNTNLQIITGNSGTDLVSLTGNATFSGDVLIQTRDIDLTGGVLTAANATFQHQTTNNLRIGNNATVLAGDMVLSQAELTTHLSLSGKLTVGRSDNTGVVRIYDLDTTGKGYEFEALSGGTLSVERTLVTDGPISLLANQDNVGGEAFTIAAIGSVSTTDTSANALAVSVGATTGNSTLRNILVGGGGNVTVTSLGSGTVTQAASTTLSAPGAGTISISSEGGITIDGTIDAGTGKIILNANTDASGAQTLSSAGMITTDNTAADSVVITVGSTTGTGFLRDISTLGGVQITIDGDSSGFNFSNASNGIIADGDVDISGQGAITVNGVINSGSGTITITSDSNDNNPTADLTVATTAELTSGGDLNLNVGMIGGTFAGSDAFIGGTLVAAGNLNITVDDDVEIDNGTWTLGANNAEVNTGGAVTFGAAQVLTVNSASALNFHVNQTIGTDGQEGFVMGAGSSIAKGTTGAAAINITVDSTTATSVLANIATAADGTMTVDQDGEGTVNVASGSTVLAEGTGNITITTEGTVDVDGTIDADLGKINIQANTDNSGAGTYTGNGLLTTNNTAADSVKIAIGTTSGSGFLRDIDTDGGVQISVLGDSSSFNFSNAGVNGLLADGDVVVTSEGSVVINGTIDSGSGSISVSADSDNDSPLNDLSMASTAVLRSDKNSGTGISLSAGSGGASSGADVANFAGSLITLGADVSVFADDDMSILDSTIQIESGTASFSAGGSISFGSGAVMTVESAGSLTFDAGTDNTTLDRTFTMPGGARIDQGATGASSIEITVSDATGTSTLGGITTATDGAVTVDVAAVQTVQLLAGSTISAGGTGDVTFTGGGTATISGTVDAGTGRIVVNTGAITMSDGGKITTDNTDIDSVDIVVSGSSASSAREIDTLGGVQIDINGNGDFTLRNGTVAGQAITASKDVV
ncbi:MAG: hypothetical protein KDL87_03765, partial [Verrucomicrobiae bacterium]|nr:hypothetical protein [Verrucomicrobiae bacterium]